MIQYRKNPGRDWGKESVWHLYLEGAGMIHIIHKNGLFSSHCAKGSTGLFFLDQNLEESVIPSSIQPHNSRHTHT